MNVNAARGLELDALGPALLRIARLHLRNDAWAEDVVSETLLAAFESQTVFEARSIHDGIRAWRDIAEQ